jgi:hypothetical protein
MPSDYLTHDQWMALADIYREMQVKTYRIKKPPGTAELYELNSRANTLAQELRMHCHYAGIQAQRVADGWKTPKKPEAPPPK